jgi:nucleoside-diphosphate-sugar epimerase
MSILITGCAGGIGSTLGYYLYNKGNTIIAVDNLSTGTKDNLFIDNVIYSKFYRCDIRKTEDLIDIINDNKVDCVIHLAAITELAACEENPQECISVNVGGTASVLEAARITGVRKVIFASTSAVYENTFKPNPNAGLHEYEEVHPRLFYSVSKKMAEDVCDSYRVNYDMDITILRYFNVFGPRQDIHRRSPPLINYLVREYKAGRVPVLYSDGNQKRDYVHVDDVCRATELCINTSFRLLNVCSGRVISVREIVKCVQTALNTTESPIYKDPAERWNVYPRLFEGKFPLKKKVVINETNKYCLGSSEDLETLLHYKCDHNLEELIIRTAQQMKV